MWEIALTAVLSLLVVWTWQFLDWAWVKPRKIERLLRQQGMNGNPYRFLVGDSKETIRMYQEADSKPIGLHDDIVPRVVPNIYHAVKTYGNYSFTWAGPRPRIFIMDLDVARDALSNHRVYRKTFKISNEAVKLLVTGLAALEDEEWTKARAKLNPAFHLNKLKPMVPAIQSCCVDTLNKWTEITSKAGGSCVVDVYPHLEVFTGSIMSQLMFNSTYTEEIKQTFLLLAELAKLARPHSRIFRIPGEKYWPTKTNRRAYEIDKYVRGVFTSMFNERVKRNAGAPPSGSMDLMDVLLERLYQGEVTESERQKVIDEAIDDCKIFFFGGFETSSNLLSWTMITLAYHQDWQARAREEVFQVLGDGKVITSEDLGKLKIVTMIVNEMLRLYPPVMELTRLVGEDVKVKNFTIPKNSLVTFPTLLYHRSTEVWGEDAGEFKPDRFADGVANAAKGAAKGDAAFMPWGWGPRICIGMNFATLESKTFVALLLREFSFELSPTYTHAPMVAVTLQPQFGAPLILKKL